VFAPGTPEQAFFLTSKAFDLAEKYQIPVLVISDQYLADTQWTFSDFDLGKLKYKDYRLRGEALEAVSTYRRHAVTDDGVSPLGLPGESKHLVVTDSDEHDEEGHIIEDGETRVQMVRKRLLKKLHLIRREIEPPLFYGDEQPEVLLTGWGSTYGVLREAVDALAVTRPTAMLHFSELYPFPSTEGFDYLRKLGEAKLTICVENNATGQFARLMRAELGYQFDRSIHKYDGRPFLLEPLLEEINAETGDL
jgi:2-oxoglutarate ferredoxin oxidoreductase subunit alpha